ncbi:fibronectin type III-like domain-contianing protein [Nocardia macrotermitis]|uniref:Exo-alpha-(1->6)-L-arabinopyranosidase n=1 Tax=Nocardia macrotermitis TaxID=2585198 RepID=A0A7K0D9A8_9NOCA|nr:fibronectin type III-like domain-contianing protein [Nocardia macrotermitis]MQY21444.1 hypothetical protein [Nocardia macrotermitis]
MSYTSFGYSDLRLETTADGITATVTITNTGTRTGREVVQFYAGLPGSKVIRAVRELKAFAETTLDPGQSTDVTVAIRREDLAYWNIRTRDWIVEPGDYEITAAASRADLRLRQTISVTGDLTPLDIHADTTLGELRADPVVAAAMDPLLQQLTPDGRDRLDDSPLGMDVARMSMSFPLGMLASFLGSDATDLVDQVQRAVATARAEHDTVTAEHY